MYAFNFKEVTDMMEQVGTVRSVLHHLDTETITHIQVYLFKESE